MHACIFLHARKHAFVKIVMPFHGRWRARPRAGIPMQLTSRSFFKFWKHMLIPRRTQIMRSSPHVMLQQRLKALRNIVLPNAAAILSACGCTHALKMHACIFSHTRQHAFVKIMKCMHVFKSFCAHANMLL